MKIWISPYELQPLNAGSQLNAMAQVGPRCGALLRFDFGTGTFGYSDCHPWPELGDLPWQEQVALFVQGRPTYLMQRSLAFARLDAEARQNQVSLWQSGFCNDARKPTDAMLSRMEIPPSHTLVPNLLELSPSLIASWAAEGQTRVKFKVGKDPVREAEVLAQFSEQFRKSGIQFRLDFNGTLSFSGFEKFLKQIDLSVLDFVEDPFPYDGPSWADLQREYKIRLALDRVPMSSNSGAFPDYPDSYSVLILKPAIQDPAIILEKARVQGASVVVTSYMDHPYGQLCAAWEASSLAAKRYPLERCGLLTHRHYEPVSGSSQWNAIFGRELCTPTTGFGFGLEFFLETQPWEVPYVG